MSIDRDAIAAVGGERVTRLVVFSDDFGRHPSSSQHLVRELLEPERGCCGTGCRGCLKNQGSRVLWVNTLGTRRPGLSLADLSRAGGKIYNWVVGAGGSGGVGWPEHLTVISPKMWPGFRRPWQRRLNERSITQAVHSVLGPREDGERRIAITTIPITADLVGQLDVDRWVYYCVDDFSVWPGLDSGIMDQMERELVEKVNDVVAVSQTLQQRIARMGKAAGLLTHGIDRDHWSARRDRSRKPGWWPDAPGPVALFWGLIDRRLDIAWCRALSLELERCGGRLVLAGPQQSPDPGVYALVNTVLPGPVAYNDLPALAAAADVLVMPYIDAPVTRAMQPLKLKEYLATGKPVVLRDLPATEPWSDAADVEEDAQAFVQTVMTRAQTGLPIGQAQARKRLSEESWFSKARQLASIWADDIEPLIRSAA